MTTQSFALIGRAFPSESFEGLHRASIASRRVRRSGAWDATLRARPVWRGSGEAIVMPAIRR